MMQRSILTYGSIAGLIVVALMTISIMMMDSGQINFTTGEIVGYISMLAALSMVFLGIAKRKREEGGRITFLRALKIGLGITLIASVLYVIGWEVLYQTAASDFMEKYSTYQIAQMEEAGAEPAEIEATKTQMAQYSEWYQNPLIRAGMTFMEIFPVGLLVSLIAAFILSRTPKPETISNAPSPQ